MNLILILIGIFMIEGVISATLLIVFKDNEEIRKFTKGVNIVILTLLMIFLIFK